MAKVGLKLNGWKALWVLCVCASAAFTATAAAQSAADKSTARRLAQEGIQLFQSQKYTEALERLQRAENLYDAPVHLLYIARCQVQLGQLVEGAETYQRLIRARLEPGAPDAFHKAVESGKTEMAELEPKIPSLRVDVEPSGLSDLHVTLDDSEVPAAGLGVDRPVNPGAHKIKAIAKGYAAPEQTLELKPGERKQISLKLAPAPTEKSGAAAQPSGKTAAQPQASAGKKGKGLELIGGLRLGAAIPGGVASTQEVMPVPDASKNVPVTDYFGSGGEFELHGGLRFLTYFAGFLFFEHLVLSPGSQ
ncbi:MAG TPA: hypothetical protein VGJ84_11570, partial [Polyangiaceae bacterium]